MTLVSNWIDMVRDTVDYGRLDLICNMPSIQPSSHLQPTQLTGLDTPPKKVHMHIAPCTQNKQKQKTMQSMKQP